MISPQTSRAIQVHEAMSRASSSPQLRDEVLARVALVIEAKEARVPLVSLFCAKRQT